MLLLSLLVGLKDGAEAPMGHHGQPFRQCFALAGGQAAWVATRRSWVWSPYRWPGPAQKQRRGGQRLQSRGCASHREHYNPFQDRRDRKEETGVGLSPARCGDWTSCLIWNRWIRIAAKDIELIIPANAKCVADTSLLLRIRENLRMNSDCKSLLS